MISDNSQIAINLVPLRSEYIDSLLEWRAQPEAQLHQPISPLSREKLENFLEKQRGNHYLDLVDIDNIIIIKDSENGAPVGWMTMEVTSRLHGLVRIGYTISNEFWGKGYATAAVGKLARELFERTIIERIEADCSIHNPASRRVLEKCGFKLIGIKHSYLRIHGERIDHHYFELLKDDLK
ncbi:GNAT family N-acetyltransferase [Candidatus Neomarinimicrobiota bacterium]